MASTAKAAPPSADVSTLAAKAANAVGIPPDLYVSLIMNGERSYKGWQTSPAGAEGPAQLMPHTAEGLSKKYGINTKDFYGNLLGGALYLKEQLHAFGDPRLAVAAYNAGPGAVRVHGGVPPYRETQGYVGKVMNGLGAQGSQAGGPQSAPTPGIPAAPSSPQQGPQPVAIPGLPGTPGTDLGALISQAAPSATTQSLMQKLGDMGGEVAARAQEPIPTPAPPEQAGQATDNATGATSPSGEQQPQPVVSLSGHLNGDLPMVTGGQNPYSHIQFAGHVDFQHINPRLLDILNKVGAKQNVIIQVISGYRSTEYSAKHGGFAGDPHTKGVAVDAYINGHPIGDVIGPDEWAKYGVRSGNTPGFYKGKPDPEHLDLIGIPVRQQGGAK